MARTGRRPGQTETREHILTAARNQFGEHGYDATTIRGIAAEAGVNPALVHHFYGTKDQVFVAALNLPVDPQIALGVILGGPRSGAGERILRLFLGLWREPATRTTFLALVRSVSTNAEAAAMLRQFIERVMLPRVSEALGVPKVRLTALVSHVIGLVQLRYIVGVDPIATLDEDELVALVAPVLQRYID
jgi:AcrR family transcriptional regulator